MVCLAAARLLGHLVEDGLVLDLVVEAVFVVQASVRVAQSVGLVEAAAVGDCGCRVALVQDLDLAGVGHVVVEVHLQLVAHPFVVAAPFLYRGVCESFFPGFLG